MFKITMKSNLFTCLNKHCISFIKIKNQPILVFSLKHKLYIIIKPTSILSLYGKYTKFQVKYHP